MNTVGPSNWRLTVRQHVNPMTVLVERDLAVHQGEQSPIAPGADIVAGHEPGAALADENAAGGDEFAAKSLNAQPFADAVAPVADAALTFLMCHKLLSVLRVRRGAVAAA